MTRKIVPPRTDEPEEVRRYREQGVEVLNDVRGRLVTAETTIDDVDGRVSASHDDSTATTVAATVIDFNSLLAKLRTAGLLTT